MITAKHATRLELATVYDLNDLADFHESMDVEIEAQDWANAKARREAEEKRSR